ncbi:MAG: Crp/Fnr family transcriptional regulator [Eubacteriales bacterium]|nr:Crp/Fnr family transcriptional regulator [Eubacteriales bacterium]MDD3200122.1 Crp/Fnr family transcriptional regulator [Eubacteriales bacterium]MDD4122127.1 Crp/Fnr family transcriptional regulator [Eubacteriales bacterium]MDD4630367.1 Crp/Fnr family transcriptional regulator [Eubacteriales bacterium]
MKNYLKTLIKSPLFQDVSENDLEAMLICLGATERKYEKNDVILLAGTKVSSVGILVEGNAQIIRDDAEGNRAILSELEKSDMFAEAYVAVDHTEIPVTVIATSGCRVVWITFSKIIGTCSSSCGFHKTLIKNMMRVIAIKNISMNEKMRILSCKTTKEKLMTYLNDYSERIGKDKFKIPFSRSELADFLSVDRSAMSRELSRLKDEGYIKYNKNEFELL